MLRSRGRRPETPSDELLATIASIDEPETRTAASRLLQRIFAREKPSTRTIAVLHFVDGMTIAEVAEVVGMPERRVRERITVLRRRARVFEEIES